MKKPNIMYTINLLDRDGYTITQDHAETFGEAKKRAAYFISPDYPASCGSTHADLKTYKAEIEDENCETVADFFLNPDGPRFF